MSASGVVQRQLKDDWDNREYEQIISDNIKNIANFLSSFELSCRSKLAVFGSSSNQRRHPFLNMSSTAKIAKTTANAVRTVAPVKSTNHKDARLAVLQVYKEFQRLTPKFWWDFGLQDMPLGVFRAVIKKQFTKNAQLTDVRVIDRLVGETHQHMYSIRYAFYNPDHVRNYLFAENIEAKPKDFLSKFLNGKE
ncbi:unnamed protein product [Caenorhabditis auriculariae]|uniref:NADH dehydrogenase [ubiquinone] 1 alpha subcomplex subunit 6 n=1 Tax=Caenorhabditis auriculariae TaxID=2777116 RepID=A0A8S1HRD6_9PELO|nr:unnamed protein product [Caenorhabditis auriculariae]